MVLFFLHFYCRFTFCGCRYKVLEVNAVIQNQENFNPLMPGGNKKVTYT